MKLCGALLPYTPNWLMRQVIKRLLVTWQHPENALLDDGAILVNQRGERFCDEVSSPRARSQSPGSRTRWPTSCSTQRPIEHYSAWPHFISTAPKIAYAYVRDYLKLRPDVAVMSSSLAGVAAARGLPAAALEQTLAEHNATAARPLSGVRWVLLGPVKAYFTTTEGGAAIDEQFRVLNEQGERFRACMPSDRTDWAGWCCGATACTSPGH